VDKRIDSTSRGEGLACHPDQPDTELYVALKSGQQAAMAILYDRYVALVHGLAMRILLQPQEAEDLTQEIFLTLWRSNTYQPNRGSLSSFLTTLTRSRAIDRLRSRRSSLKFLQRWSQTMMSEQSQQTPFEAASIGQRSEVVRTALSQLPENQRQVLEMAYYGGLSQSEIAATLETPLGTIKTWSRKGLLNLREHLKNLID
jgi:RNA polymerase sigma-70 factor, ECF subfamily